MPTKRWIIAAVLLISVAISPLLAYPLLPDEPGVTRANFGRVEIGMSRAEVEEVFGTSPSDKSRKGKTWFTLHLT